MAGHNFDPRAKSSCEDVAHEHKKFSQENLALKSKLRPAKFSLHCPIFAGNSRSTCISQLQAGKTRSKRLRSHCLSTGHLLPYMWASFYPLDPSRYLSSFSSCRPKTKKFPFFMKLHCRSRFFLPACSGLNFDATDLPNS